jgi:hypothetical protein
VTNGGSEANFTALWGCWEKGDHAAVMLPNYLQTWGFPAPTRQDECFYLVEGTQETGTKSVAGPWTLTVCIEQ